MKTPCGVIAMVASMLIASTGPLLAGGECAPKLREIEAKLTALPSSPSKEQVRLLYEAAEKAASNYDDEGCLEHAKEALEKIAEAKE